MRTWMVWCLLIVGVSAIILLSYWLTSTLSIWDCNTIVIVVNFIVSCYLILGKAHEAKS